MVNIENVISRIGTEIQRVLAGNSESLVFAEVDLRVGGNIKSNGSCRVRSTIEQEQAEKSDGTVDREAQHDDI